MRRLTKLYTSFRVEIPEGETIVTITDRGPDAEELGFDVPSGGAFRVLDVIVTEAPRFSPAN